MAFADTQQLLLSGERIVAHGLLVSCGHGSRLFEFLDRLDACVLLSIAKYELYTLAQFYCLNFVSDLPIGQSVGVR